MCLHVWANAGLFCISGRTILPTGKFISLFITLAYTGPLLDTEDFTNRFFIFKSKVRVRMNLNGLYKE